MGEAFLGLQACVSEGINQGTRIKITMVDQQVWSNTDKQVILFWSSPAYTWWDSCKRDFSQPEVPLRWLSSIAFSTESSAESGNL